MVDFKDEETEVERFRKRKQKAKTLDSQQEMVDSLKSIEQNLEDTASERRKESLRRKALERAKDVAGSAKGIATQETRSGATQAALALAGLGGISETVSSLIDVRAVGGTLKSLVAKRQTSDDYNPGERSTPEEISSEEYSTQQKSKPAERIIPEYEPVSVPTGQETSFEDREPSAVSVLPETPTDTYEADILTKVSSIEERLTNPQKVMEDNNPLEVDTELSKLLQEQNEMLSRIQAPAETIDEEPQTQIMTDLRNSQLEMAENVTQYIERKSEKELDRRVYPKQGIRKEDTNEVVMLKSQRALSEDILKRMDGTFSVVLEKGWFDVAMALGTTIMEFFGKKAESQTEKLASGLDALKNLQIREQKDTGTWIGKTQKLVSRSFELMESPSVRTMEATFELRDTAMYILKGLDVLTGKIDDGFKSLQLNSHFSGLEGAISNLEDVVDVEFTPQINRELVPLLEAAKESFEDDSDTQAIFKTSENEVAVVKDLSTEIRGVQTSTEQVADAVIASNQNAFLDSIENSRHRVVLEGILSLFETFSLRSRKRDTKQENLLRSMDSHLEDIEEKGTFSGFLSGDNGGILSALFGGAAGGTLLGKGKALWGKGVGLASKGFEGASSLIQKIFGLSPKAASATPVASSVASKGLLKKGSSLLGKAAVPLQAVMGIFDALEGWTDARYIGDIPSSEEVSTKTKVLASLSSVISGLGFGIADSKELYDGFQGMKEYFFNEEFGVVPTVKNAVKELINNPPSLTGIVSDLMHKTSKFFKDQYEDATGMLRDLYLDNIKPILNFFKFELGEIYDDVFKESVDSVKRRAKQITSSAWDWLSTSVTKAADSVTSVVNSATTKLESATGLTIPKIPTSGRGALNHFGISSDTLTSDTLTADIIKKFEGYHPGSYVDIAGKGTVGYGHLKRPGEDFSSLTKTQAEELLHQDIGKHQTFLKDIQVPINKHEKAALTSLAFNVGTGSMKSIVDLFNEGDKKAVADKIMEFNKFKNPEKGKYEVSPGLTKRRAAERAIFLTEPVKDSEKIMQEDAQLERQSRQRRRGDQPIRMPAPAPIKTQSSIRRTNTDDYGIAIVNSLMLEG